MDEFLKAVDSQSIFLFPATAPEKRIEIKNRGYCYVSEMLKTALEGDLSCKELSVSIRPDLLPQIVEYLLMAEGTDIPEVPRPLSNEDLTQVLNKPPFEESIHLKFAHWINKIAGPPDVEREGECGKSQLYDLVMAASYLNIKGLLMLGLAKVCTYIKGASLPELKKKLLPPGRSEFAPNTAITSKAEVSFAAHAPLASPQLVKAPHAPAAAAAAASTFDDVGAKGLGAISED